MSKKATLYRMVKPDHLCPYGLKAKHLLERQGYVVEDHHLANDQETEAFKAEHGVKTTPQTFINGDRIGGYDDLKVFFGKTTREKINDDSPSYKPVAAIFATTALMALSLTWATPQTLLSMALFEHFIALSMCVLGIMKLRDISSFSSMFLGYDLLARRDVRYAYFYPFAETGAGILMLGGVLPWLSVPVALFIGSVGAASVVKAVYIDQRELRCACVGGDSNVPLGAISLTENVMMVLMALWLGTSLIGQSLTL